jgi:FtsP/CotA-like multicopper oxidase with cupredoxin domain
MNDRNRCIAAMLDLRHQLTEARLGRRELAKLGLIAGGAYWAKGASLRAALAKETAISPRTRPWVEAMPPANRPLAETPMAGYDEAAHQYGRHYRPKRTYKIPVMAGRHSFHKDLPASTIWGFGGVFPGPTIDARYGDPVLIRFLNQLPTVAGHKGFGHPEIATHLHNFHSASESDGGPWNWLKPGESRDQHYGMMRAGFTRPERTPAEFRDAWGGDKRESLTTLFFHDHRPEFTSANVYKGMVGVFRIFDEDDTGEEGKGWNLPCGDYDVPLVLADKQFDPRTGALTFDQFATDGFLGDKITVNGKIQPYFVVERRKYRFRLINGGPSRFYNLVLRQGGRSQPFTQITASGNFLEFARRDLTSIELWVAERSDIVVDFSRFKAGDKVYLANTMVMRDNGRGADRGKTLRPDDVANQVLEFRIVEAKSKDRSQVPSRFRPLPPVNLAEVVRTRHWKLERKNGAWAINGQFWDPDIDHAPEFIANPPHQVKRDTAEVWVLESSSGGWDHPMHIHFEEGIAFRQNGTTIAPQNRYRTDVHRMAGNKLEVFMRFRDFPQPDFPGAKGDAGRYVMHCHNTVHEDHSMMATFTIVP